MAKSEKKEWRKKLIGECAVAFDKAMFEALVQDEMERLAEKRIKGGGITKRHMDLRRHYPEAEIPRIIAEEKVRTRLALKRAKLRKEPLSRDSAKASARIETALAHQSSAKNGITRDRSGEAICPHDVSVHRSDNGPDAGMSGWGR